MADLPALSALAAARVQDSAAALPSAPSVGIDSIVTESPLPSGLDGAVRFLFNLPQGVQIGGVVLGLAAVVALLVLLAKRRERVIQWLDRADRRLRYALAAGILVLVLGAAGVGVKGYDYVQHSNGLCQGCHIMDPAFQEFTAFVDKHDSLSCHDCHKQSMFASLRQVYLWVAERPEHIGVHAKVANAVCESCHVTGDSAVWQRIASTAGHRVHLESSAPVLQGAQCVTCHGVEVHRFVPARSTCGQSGCHAESETAINLGRMRAQTSVHCVVCHRFTAEVPALATGDSARGTLVPRREQCLNCHEMQSVLAEFDEGRDPHGGTCGTCHNPHTQQTPREAATSCASARCHGNWETIPFHVGSIHRRMAGQCLTCHDNHSARVDASDCVGCHEKVRSRSGRRPPVPFDTAAALRRIGALTEEPEGQAGEWFWGNAPPVEGFTGGFFITPTPQLQDSFPHARHRSLACLECHTTREGRLGLAFEAPRGCNICHHQAPESSRCEACHGRGPETALVPTAVQITLPDGEARRREWQFPHDPHQAFPCVACHTQPVTLAVEATPTLCALCHADHSTPGRDCTACHLPETTGAAHQDGQQVHERCDACHTGETVAELMPDRLFCATCHQPQRSGHYEPRQCSVCHFLREPEELKGRLGRPPS